jgi:hypothetical protein
MSTRGRPWALGIGLLVAFSAVFLLGGHGAGPIGMLLFLGWRGWPLQMLVGWLAIALIISGLAVRDAKQGLELRQGGGVVLAIAWITFALQSEYFGVTLLTSIPFLGCLVGWAIAVWPDGRSDESPTPTEATVTKDSVE